MVLFLLSCNVHYSQEEPPVYAPEFYIHVKNATPNTTIKFSLEKISTGYCYDADIVPNQFVVCSDCLPYCSSCEGSTVNVEINSLGNNHSTQEGWGLCAFELGTKDPPHFGFAVYKLTQIESNDYIYLDIRDIRYSRYIFGGYTADFIIRYNADGYFEFDANTDGTFTFIQNHDLQQIWDGDWDGDGYIDYSSPEVDLFPQSGQYAYWQNCLAVGYHYDENNPQPLQILWGRYPDENQYTYYLFREIDSGGFVLIGVFNSSSFNYQDKSIFCQDGAPFNDV